MRAPLSIALLALAGAGALLDARVALRGNPPLVSAEAMGRARDAIEAERRPGDLVVHSPLLSVTELAPLGAMVASPALPSPELRASRRVLLLDVLDAPMGGFGRPSHEAVIESAGRGLALRVYEPEGGAAVTHFDLVTDLGRARMRVERPAGTPRSSCTTPRAEGGFSCPGEPEWLYLARRELRIGGRNTPCAWAHPTTGGAIVIELPAAPTPPPGRRLELVVRGGLVDEAVTGTPDGAAVDTELRQSGRRLSVLTTPNALGWVERRQPIEGGRPVELSVTTVRDGRRHFCLDARIEEVDGE